MPLIRTGRRDGSGPRPRDRFFVPKADLLSLFVRPLNQLGWAYAVTGEVGSMFYAEPRFTNDIDVVMRIPSDGGPALREAFPEPEFYRPGPEEIAVEVLRPSRGHLNVIHLESGLKADFYLVGTDPVNDWALSASRMIPVSDLPVHVAPPEYVVTVIRPLKPTPARRSRKPSLRLGRTHDPVGPQLHPFDISRRHRPLRRGGRRRDIPRPREGHRDPVSTACA